MWLQADVTTCLRSDQIWNWIVAKRKGITDACGHTPQAWLLLPRPSHTPRVWGSTWPTKAQLLLYPWENHTRDEMKRLFNWPVNSHNLFFGSSLFYKHLEKPSPDVTLRPGHAYCSVICTGPCGWLSVGSSKKVKTGHWFMPANRFRHVVSRETRSLTAKWTLV